MVAVTVDQLMDALVAAAGDQGAQQIDISAMRIAMFAGDYVAAATDALSFIDAATLDADTITAYRAFRATVTNPDDLALLPDIPVPVAA